MLTACPAVGYACAMTGYWRMERHSPGTARSPTVSDASPDTDCPGRACARTIVPGERTSFPGGQRSIVRIRLHRPDEPRMTESQYAHCQSDATRGCEARDLRRQGTDGREARREGASPAPTGGERQSGMFDPRCGERWCACLLSGTGFTSGKVGRTLEPTGGLPVFVRYRRASDVSAQAFERETLARLAERASMEGGA